MKKSLSDRGWIEPERNLIQVNVEVVEEEEVDCLCTIVCRRDCMLQFWGSPATPFIPNISLESLYMCVGDLISLYVL